MKQFVKFSALVVCLLLFSASSAYATPVEVEGSSPLRDGDLYIPITPTTSGTYGDNGIVGMTPDSVTLAPGQSSSGSVEFVIEYSLDGQYGPDEWMDVFTTMVQLVLTDLDFDPQPVAGGKVEHKETAEIQFVNEELQTVGNSFILNESNWRNYLEGGPNSVATTNNTRCTYELGVEEHLGVTAAQGKALTHGKDILRLVMRLGATVTNKSYRSLTVNNTIEDGGSLITINGVAPEPATMLLLGMGGVTMLIRRRRR